MLEGGQPIRVAETKSVLGLKYQRMAGQEVNHFISE
jgi:hypothetical protein